ncbi:hypothetical protein JQR88_23775 (plasmid) [Pseudomonas luteola]|uniref:hypothetical protein n=1 Tax=Pseudomonas luteola TaxID=47886 RepID=UPI003DA01E35
MKFFSACLIRPVYLVIILMFFNGCEKNKEYKPKSNTEEYNIAHGIENGKANTIIIGKAQFKLPDNTRFKVYTNGEIIRHKADKLTLWTKLSKNNSISQSSSKSELNYLRIEVSHRPLTNTSSLRPEKQNYHFSFHDMERGLTVFKGTESSFLYLAKENNLNTIKLYCSPVSNIQAFGTNGPCRTAYHLPSGMLIEIFFPMEILDDWRGIIKESVETVEKYRIN